MGTVLTRAELLAIKDVVVPLAEEVGRWAKAECEAHYRGQADVNVSSKTSPGDVVTRVDYESQRRIAEALAAAYPGFGLLGEEDGLAEFDDGAPVWVIDPIDGTSAFAAGSPDFALMVALVRDGRSELGWILAPALGEITFGGIDHGVWQGTRGNAPVQLRPAAPPSQLAAMVGILGKRNITPQRRAELEAKARHFKALEGVTCAGLDYARLARGDVQFALYSKSEPWDHLPGLGILAGLGFRAAKHDGTPYRPGDNTGGLVVAPDAASLDRIRSAMLD